MMGIKSKEIVKQDSKIDVWRKPDKIRQLFAPTLTEDEFMFFIGLGKSMGANPFKREIWAIKYAQDSPAQVFLGRDFYRKAAQSQPDYKVHRSFAVYSNDKFKVKNGLVEHEFQLKDRGSLIGAWSELWKKNIDIPFVNYVEFKEYTTGKSLWNKKPATMICKVSEAQVLKMGYQEIFAGTYSEDEQWQEESAISDKYKQEPPAIKKDEPIIEAEIVEPEKQVETETEEKDYHHLIENFLYCEFPDKEEAANELERMTTFDTVDKDTNEKKTIKGKREVGKLKDKQAMVTWHKFQKEYNLK